MNRTVRNILIAAVVGVITGMILGGLFPLVGLTMSPTSTTVGVGVAIGVTFALLNSNKNG